MISFFKSMFSKLTDTSPIIKFKCNVSGYELVRPVVCAKDVKPEWMVKQIKEAERTNKIKFSACPGMHDYYRSGYIIPAWEDFEIIVDEKDIKINIGTGTKFSCLPWETMAYSVVAGAANIDEDIAPHAVKLPCPWKVFTKPGYSAFVIPALYHSPFLRDLYLYPGINDYDEYHTINVMLSPLRKMHVKIYAGTPLLQVIPYKREDITAEVGYITREEAGLATFKTNTKAPGFYRRFIHQKKTTSITFLHDKT